MRNNNKLIPRKYRPLVVPTVSLFIVLTIVLFAAPRLWGQISDASASVEAARKKQVVLEEKATILERFKNSQDLLMTEDVMVAVPQENPSLLALSQVRSLAEQTGLAVERIKIGTSAAAGESSTASVMLSMTLIGPQEAVQEFAKGLAKLAPILKLDKADIRIESGVATAGISVKSFWAPLPAKLGAVDQPVGDLTPQEKELLREIAGLTKPDFVEGVVVTSPSGRTDPFSF